MAVRTVASWTVSEEPVLRLGTADAAADDELFSNVEGVRLLADGRIAVANRGSSEVRLFDADGHAVGRVGRAGEGPGEFRWLAWIGECEPGVLDVYDPIPGRLTRFDLRSLRLESTRQLETPSLGRQPSVLVCADGGHVGVTRHLMAPPGQPGAIRWPVSVDYFPSDGSPRHITEVPGDDRFWDGGSVGPLAFGREAVVAVAADLVVIGTQDESPPRVQSLENASGIVLDWDPLVRPLTSEERRKHSDQTLSRASSESARVRTRNLLRDYPYPEHHPTHGSITFDAEGYLWLEEPRATASEGTPWRVFHRDGRSLGTVLVPSGLRVHDIGRNAIAGLVTDALGVEYVVVHALHRQEESTGLR